MNKTILTKSIVPIILLLTLFPVAGLSQYVIGPADILDVKFWQQNSLDASVTVTQDGKISLDIIGEIVAAGLTTAELEKKIVRQMSRYNKAITTAVVRVVQYGSQRVYITGQVLNPGKYTFEEIPDLWTLINEAGGIAEAGDLSRVLIIRGGEQAGNVEVVNVAALVASGRAKELPRVRAGDTIEIPRTPAGLPAISLGDQREAKSIFYVTGEVLTPGPKTLDPDIDVLDAISMAGGPTENADLKNVKVISKDGLQTQIMRINLKKFVESGSPGRYMIRPEDTIILSRKSRGFLGLGTVTDWIAIIGTAASVIFIYDRISSDNGS